MSGRGLFITGTDTGVGKTTVSVGLCAALARRGLRVAAMKPCETGDGDDAARLLAATGRSLDPSWVNPYRFALPAAPAIAAASEARAIDLDPIESAYRSLAAEADWIVVEGAGGLLVPLTESITIADLCARLALPLLIVARTRLGTINHTLLTAEAARRRGLRLLGAVFCRTQEQLGPEEAASLAAITRTDHIRSFGVIPFIPLSSRRDPIALGESVEAHVNLDDLLHAAT